MLTEEARVNLSELSVLPWEPGVKGRFNALCEAYEAGRKDGRAATSRSDAAGELARADLQPLIEEIIECTDMVYGPPSEVSGICKIKDDLRAYSGPLGIIRRMALKARDALLAAPAATPTDAIRSVLAECADWLESRPDYTEGDAATASRAREALAATPPVGPALEWAKIAKSCDWEVAVPGARVTLIALINGQWILNCYGLPDLNEKFDAVGHVEAQAEAEARLRAFFAAGLSAFSGATATGEQR